MDIAIVTSNMGIVLFHPSWLIWVFMVIVFLVALWQFFNPAAASRWQAGSLYANSTSPARMAFLRIFALIGIALVLVLAIGYIVGWIQ